MRYLLVAIPLLLGPVALATSARAETQISIGISTPGLQIGVNMPTYPQLVRVPGYPVYYAPQASSNYFFYDGLYWVYQNDDWYSSGWYNGPWQRVGPEYVPLYVLRVPVRYYRRPPAYFRGWRSDAPPRWNEHWGRDWEQQHRGWDRWDRRAAPAPAPLPSYQRPYSGTRYPSAVEQQQTIRSQTYRYQPREPVSQQHYQQSGRTEPQSRPQAPQPQPQAQPRPQRAPAQAEPRNPGQDRKAPSHSAGPDSREVPHNKGQDKKAGNADKGKGKDDKREDGGQK